MAYGEMAVTLMALDKRPQAADWLRRGLAIVARQKATQDLGRSELGLLRSVTELEQRLQVMLADVERT